MILVVCLDDRDGMTFLKRRQSQDSVLRSHVLAMSRDSKLWMNGYSARQFEELASHVTVDEEFLNLASPGEFCFVENTDVKPVAQRVEKLVIYRWNRHYPADAKFPMAEFAERMMLLEQGEFAGSSHENITWEVYGL